MAGTFGYSLFLLAVVSLIPDATGIGTEDFVKDTIGDVSGIYNGGERVKRAAISVLGLLLKTANVRRRSKFSTTYKKKGGYSQALKDFEDLGPSDVIKRGAYRWGKVNGQAVIVRKHGDKTTLDIWGRIKSPKGKVVIIVDKIEYTN